MFKVRTKNDSKGDLLVEGNREIGVGAVMSTRNLESFR